MSVLPPPYLQFLNANGDPLSGGTVETYQAGTTTPKATYTDSTLTTPVTNPIVLDAAGIPVTGNGSIWVSGAYKTIVKDSNGTVIKTTDNITSYSATGGAGTSGMVTGQCQLNLTGGNVVLSAYNGNNLIINGTVCTVPTNLPLAATGLTPGVVYYIYAVDSDGDGTVDLLEPSGTAYTKQSSGIYTKTGDLTRSLVGMARVDTGPAWGQVRSFFHDMGMTARASFSADRTTNSTTLAEINTEIRVGFLPWAGEIFTISFVAQASVATVNVVFNTAISLDSSGAPFINTLTLNQNTANNRNNVSHVVMSTTSEAYHFATILGSVASGTLTYYNSASLMVTCKGIGN